MRRLYSNLKLQASQLSALKHLLWINESSMLLVKEDGKAYTFDIMNCYLNYFEKFSKDAASVLSSPDSSCIFVLEPKTTHPAAVNTDENTVQALVFSVNQDCKPQQVEIPLPSHSLIHCRFTYAEQ